MAESESKRKANYKDGDPLPEKEWAPDPGERPYSEAVTEEHKEHLAKEGIQV